MGSHMLESQDLFATPSMSWSRHGRRLRPMSSTTPPQSPSRSVKRRVRQLDHTPLAPDLPLGEGHCNTEPPRSNTRRQARDDRALWKLMGYEYKSKTETNRHTQERHGSNLSGSNGKRSLPREGAFSVCKREKPCLSAFILCGLLLLMLLSGFIGALCYSIILENYEKETETNGVEVLKESAVKVNDLESSLSIFTAVTHQINELKHSVQSLSQELATIQHTFQNNKSEVQTERVPGSIYEELLGRQADLASAGNFGSVLATPDTEPVKLEFSHLPPWMSYFLPTPHVPASTTIMGLIRDVGDCWMFAGHRGRLVLSLNKASVLSSVSITHIAPADTLSAPRHFKVLVHYSEEDLEDGVLLGEFEYNQNGPWRQTFLLNPNIVKDELLRLIEFRFVTNHGHPNYTCVYRVHVHGHPGNNL